MHAPSNSDSPFGRKIETRLTPRSLAPRVYEALQALGYTLDGNVHPGFDDAHASPALQSSNPSDADEALDAESGTGGIWLVDEVCLDEIPSVEEAPDAQILLVASPKRHRATDPRIVAEAVRPGRLSAVYSMIQEALEGTPRRSPRIRTKLSARCLRADRQSIGAVLSLSEGGCLLRTNEMLKRGAKLNLQFALPEYGLVSTAAQCRYVRKGDAGIEFERPAVDIRQSIAHFVTLQLAETQGHYLA